MATAASWSGTRFTVRRALSIGPSVATSRQLPAKEQRRYSSTVESPENAADQGWWDRVQIHEIMTTDPITVNFDTSIFSALELLTEHHISGLPVLDEKGEVIGVVTAYDILALDSTPGQLDKSDGFFPPIDRSSVEFDGDENAMWRSFLSLRNGIAKAQATKVGDSMHETFTVFKDDSLSDVANLIVRKNTQRAFVLDDDRKLCGVVSRGDILGITMSKYREIKEGKSD